MGFLISDAVAAAPAQAAQADGTVSLVMIVAIFVLFYFMLIRPQNKRAKAHRELINNVKKGDEVVSSGGLLGKVTQMDDSYMKVIIAEGVEVRLQRNAISAVLPKGTLKSL